MIRRAVGLLTCLLLLVGLAGLAFGAEEGPLVIKIGAIYPLTGPLSVEGMQVFQALRVCEDIVNESYDIDSPGDIFRCEGLPNLDGAKIKFIFADSEGKPDVGRSEAERLITLLDVDIIVGCWQSSVTSPVSVVAEIHGIPHVNFDSSAVSLTERGLRYFFRTQQVGAAEAKYMLEFVADVKEARPDLDIVKVAIVCEDTLYGQDFANWWSTHAGDYGLEVVVNIPYPHESTDLDAEVLRIKRADPDLILMAPYLPDAVLFQKTFKKYDISAPVLGSTGHIRVEFEEALGSDVNGVMAMDLWSDSLIETNKMAGIFTQLMRDRYGEGAAYGNLPSRAYIGTVTLMDAINRAGSVDPEAIRQALVETDIPGEFLPLPVEGVKFDEKGQNIYGGIVIIQWQNQKMRVVWPWTEAEAEVMAPLPPWDER